MILTIVFEPDPSMGPDPSDDATPPDPRRQGLVLDSNKDDLILIYRSYGDQYINGERTTVIGTGIWLHANLRQIGELIESLNE